MEKRELTNVGNRYRVTNQKLVTDDVQYFVEMRDCAAYSAHP